MQFLERLGLREPLDKEDAKLTLKHQAVNMRSANGINILHSLHANAVQRSDYLQVDHDLTYDIHLDPKKLEQMNQNKKRKCFPPGESIEDQLPLNQVFLKYCKADEVNK